MIPLQNGPETSPLTPGMICWPATCFLDVSRAETATTTHIRYDQSPVSMKHKSLSISEEENYSQTQPRFRPESHNPDQGKRDSVFVSIPRDSAPFSSFTMCKRVLQDSLWSAVLQSCKNGTSPASLFCGGFVPSISHFVTHIYALSSQWSCLGLFQRKDKPLC